MPMNLCECLCSGGTGGAAAPAGTLGCVRTVRCKTLDTLPSKYQHTVGEAGDHVLSER